jgi:hypothetical protein
MTVPGSSIMGPGRWPRVSVVARLCRAEIPRLSKSLQQPVNRPQWRCSPRRTGGGGLRLGPSRNRSRAARAGAMAPGAEIPCSCRMTLLTAPEVCSPPAISSRLRSRTGSPRTSKVCTSATIVVGTDGTRPCGRGPADLKAAAQPGRPELGGLPLQRGTGAWIFPTVDVAPPRS